MCTRTPVAPAVLTTEQAANYLAVKPTTLLEWRTRRRGDHGPAFIRVGKYVRYRVADLDAWLARHLDTGEAA